MSNFKPGNLVRFKDGASIMIVVSVEGELVDCALIPRADNDPIIRAKADDIEKAIGAAVKRD